LDIFNFYKKNLSNLYKKYNKYSCNNIKLNIKNNNEKIYTIIIDSLTSLTTLLNLDSSKLKYINAQQNTNFIINISKEDFMHVCAMMEQNTNRYSYDTEEIFFINKDRYNIIANNKINKQLRNYHFTNEEFFELLDNNILYKPVAITNLPESESESLIVQFFDKDTHKMTI
jgi:hypothetical protein